MAIFDFLKKELDKGQTPSGSEAGAENKGKAVETGSSKKQLGSTPFDKLGGRDVGLDNQKNKAIPSKKEKSSDDKKEGQSPRGSDSQQLKRQSINLIPGPTEEEIVVEETKTKRSLSGFLFIAFVVFLAVVVLGFNLWTKIQLNNVQQELVDTENEISLKQLEEIQQKNLNNKLDAYKAVKDQDFNSDSVLMYLLEVTEGLSDVKTLYLDNTMKFEIRGTATSYTNVARLWHDMSREEDYFESISLDRVSRASESGSVQFVFSGFMIKDQVVTL
jgi:hypothetical protein